MRVGSAWQAARGPTPVAGQGEVAMHRIVAAAAVWIILAAQRDPPMPCDRRCSCRDASVHGPGA